MSTIYRPATFLPLLLLFLLLFLISNVPAVIFGYFTGEDGSLLALAGMFAPGLTLLYIYTLMFAVSPANGRSATPYLVFVLLFWVQIQALLGWAVTRAFGVSPAAEIYLVCATIFLVNMVICGTYFLMLAELGGNSTDMSKRGLILGIVAAYLFWLLPVLELQLAAPEWVLRVAVALLLMLLVNSALCTHTYSRFLLPIVAPGLCVGLHLVTIF